MRRPLFPSVLIGLIAALAGAAAVGLVSNVLQTEGAGIHRYARHRSSCADRLSRREHDRDWLAARYSAYGNDALLYYIPAKAAASISFNGRKSAASSAPHGHHPALSGRRDGVRSRLGDFLTSPDAVRATPYAIGGNMNAAVRSGIPVDRRIISSTSCRPRLRDRRLPVDAALHRGVSGHRRSAALSSIAASSLEVSMFGGARTVIGR
jgi:ribose transport system permease protein